MASAIITGPKRVENRYTNIANIPSGGIWIIIHAGKSLWPSTQQSMIDAGWKDCPPIEELPRGCALGLAHVVKNVRYDPSQNTKLRENKWATGPWCMVIDQIIAFSKVIEMPGKQGLWHPPADLLKYSQEILMEAGEFNPENDIWEIL